MKSLIFKAFLLVMVFIGTIAVGHAQNVTSTISGKVTDGSGEPVIGAAISIPSLKIGTITDIDGVYDLKSIIAAGTYKLEVSYVGYTTKSSMITISGAAANIDQSFVIEEDLLRLDEVVVIGASAATNRKALGNAITTVTAKDVERAGTGNAISALQGKVAGARITQVSGDPSGAMAINLRGINSISGSSDPLYVIDGVIVSK